MIVDSAETRQITRHPVVRSTHHQSELGIDLQLCWKFVMLILLTTPSSSSVLMCHQQIRMLY